MPVADTTETDPKDQFNDAVYANYDEYNYILANRTKDYELLVVSGKTGSNVSYGIFIDNKTNHPMDAFITDGYLSYHIPFTDHTASFPKVKLTHNKEYTITVTDLISDQDIINDQFTTNPSGVSLNTAFDIFSGLGQNALGAAISLPVSVETKRIVNLLSILSIILFLGIIAAIVIFKKNRMPRYHHAETDPVHVPDHREDNDDIIDAKYEDAPQEAEKPSERNAIVDKQSYMNNLFRMYENKEITEEELNEELKKIWGKHD